MLIPLHVLDKLRCASCKNYLSQGPVLVREDGSNICGRCVESDPTMPNDPYNELAELCLFPCRYEVEGCTEKVPFRGMRDHEEDCEFRTYACPVLPGAGCQWTGTKGKMLAHCGQFHQDNTLAHPAEMQHDVRSNSFKTFVLSAFDVVFLIYVKVLLSTNSIYHFVRKVGLVTPNHVFRYKLNIENDNGNIIRKGEVATQDNLTFSEDLSISIDLHQLTDLLAGFEKTKFCVTIRELMRCFICNVLKNAKQFMYFDERFDIFYCRACYATLTQCSYHPQGCMLVGKGDIATHEKYFCKYNTWCEECGENIFESYMLQHLQNVTHTSSEYQHLFEKYWTVVKETGHETVTTCSKDEAFLLSYRKEDTGPHRFYLQGRHDLIRIICVLNLRNPGTKLLGQFIMNRVYSVNNSQFLWESLVPENRLQPFLDNLEFQMGVAVLFNS